MTALRNAGALDLVGRDRRRRASPPDQARKWWLGELSRRANESGVELAALPITAGPGGQGQSRWSRPGRSTTSWPGRCSTACWPARARPTRSWPPAAWPWSATTARCWPRSTRRSRPIPDVAAKIRDGKMAAAGALVGAVMKANGGQADAARVRELILERLAQS